MLRKLYTITGEAVIVEIGKITFFHNVFKSKEELLRTLVYKREYIWRFREFGTEFLQNNIA